jgi:hypothetical protein
MMRWILHTQYFFHRKQALFVQVLPQETGTLCAGSSTGNRHSLCRFLSAQKNLGDEEITSLEVY